MAYIDLDELEVLDANIKVFGYNTRASYSFYDKDHFKFINETNNTAKKIAREKISYSPRKYKGKTTKQRIELMIRELKLGFHPDKVFLLTNLRNHNYVFNPVSFYYCFDKEGNLRAMFSEVNNTWGDQKMYYVLTDPKKTEHRDKQRKNFYVSPFIDYDTDLHWTFTEPGERLRMIVDSKRKNTTELRAVLIGGREEFSEASLKKARWKYPFITYMIIIWIHVQALRLWLKKVPFLKKKETDKRILRALKKH